MRPGQVSPRPQRSSCDQCYKLKVKCERETATQSCTRCSRLGERCRMLRPIRPAGRRRRRQDQETIEDPSDPCHVNIKLSNGAAPWLDILPVLPSDRSSIPDGLLESMSSCVITGADRKTSMGHASSALVTLRSLPVRTLADAHLCIRLGTVLALYVYATIGVGVVEVCRYCLSTTESFFDDEPPDEDIENCCTMLVLLETMEAVARRQKATLRIKAAHSTTIDRFMGLSTSLLPLYHDLCAVSYKLAMTKNVDIIRQTHRKLDSIQNTLAAWQPKPPKNMLTDRPPAEVVFLLAQAKAYRLGALLMAHRLRNAFGEQDGQADIWSHEVMLELDLARAVTKRPIRYVTLPFILAAVEARGVEARTKVLNDVKEYVDHFTPVVQETTKIFLVRVWNDRDRQEKSSWLDSIHTPCVVVNSLLDTT